MLKSPGMPSPDRLRQFDVISSSTSNTDTAFTSVNVSGELPSNGLPYIPSTTQLLPHHNHGHFQNYQRPEPNHLCLCGRKASSVANSLDIDMDRQSTSVHSKKKKGECVLKCSWLCILSIVFFIITLVINGYLYVTFKNKFEMLEKQLNSMQSTQALTQEEPRLCLPCTDLTLGPFAEDSPGLDKLYKLEENGKSVCCAKTTTQFSILLNLVSTSFLFKVFNK